MDGYVELFDIPYTNEEIEFLRQKESIQNQFKDKFPNIYKSYTTNSIPYFYLIGKIFEFQNTIELLENEINNLKTKLSHE